MEAIRICISEPMLSHLLFIDDTLNISSSYQTELQEFIFPSSMYCRVSGQQISLQKSIIYFGVNTPAHLALELCNVLEMPKVEDPGKYLGLPTIWGRSKNETLQFIKDQILTKIAVWKQRFLSQAGKEVFIKVVVQAFPMYPMCVFRLPVSVCKDIDAAVPRFWWAGADKDCGMHWVN